MSGPSLKSIESIVTLNAKPNDFRPEPSAYEPMVATHWTLLEAIVWVATRESNKVREVAPQYRNNWITWRLVTQDYPYDEQGNFAPFLPGTTQGRTRKIWRPTPVGHATFRDVASGLASIHMARKELWSELASGKIVATGIPGLIRYDDEAACQNRLLLDLAAMRPLEARRGEIPKFEWSDLHMPGDEPRKLSEGPMTLDESFVMGAVRQFDREEDGPDRVRSERGIVYSGVCLLASDVLGEWQSRDTLDAVLLAAANLCGGKLTQAAAVEIARQRGVFTTREQVRERLKTLGIEDKQGRKRKTP